MIVIATVLTVAVLWIAFCGYQWSWGSFARLHDMKTASLWAGESLWKAGGELARPL